MKTLKTLFLIALSQAHKLSFRVTGEAKHLVEERIHWEPPAIAGNFIVE